MKVRFDTIGYPLYCDVGLHNGDMRIDLAIRLMDLLKDPQ
jgi:hypothetical protein